MFGTRSSFSGQTFYGLGLALLFFIYTVQNIIAPNFSVIASELGLSDASKDRQLGGELSVVFYVVGVVSATIVGILMNYLHSYVLLGLILLIGEISTFSTFWVNSFSHLLLCRALSSVALGGSIPIIYSILSSHFPSASHMYIVGSMNFAITFGLACGQLFAGSISVSNGWRLPFILLAIPTILVFVVFLTISHEPRRTARDLYLMKYHVKKDQLIATSSFIIFIYCIGSIIGQIFGYYCGLKLYHVDERWRCIFMGVSTAITVFPTLAIVLGPVSPSSSSSSSVSYSVYYVTMSFIAGFLSGISRLNVIALLQSVCTPESRGLVLSVFTLLEELSKGIGAVLVAASIPLVGDRIRTFAVGVCFWLLAGMCLLLTSLHIRRDEAAVQTRLKAALDQAFKGEAHDDGDGDFGGHRSFPYLGGGGGGVGEGEEKFPGVEYEYKYELAESESKLESK
eukprot:gene9872-20537_t